MSIDLNTVSLPFDRWGTAASNKRVGERHTLTSVAWTEFNILIPKYAPYYSESIANDGIIHLPSGKRLVRGKDWIEGWYFQSASGEIGLDIHCCIYFYDPTLAGEVEIVSYQAMGGEWQLNGQLLTQILAQKLLNPLRYYWEQIAELPEIFNPLDHDQDIQDFTKLGDLLDVLREIAQAIGQDDPIFEAHIANKNNPHGTNAVHVGLGLVMNWPIAVLADLTAGALKTEAYMNPPMTYQMIQRFAIPAITAHANRVDNPHNTRADQTGAYFRAEVDALLESLARGLIHNIYAYRLEGKSVQEIVDLARGDATGGMDELRALINTVRQEAAAHAARTDNPHNTRADKTGAYFTTEVDALLDALSAGNLHDVYAYRLEGKSVQNIVDLSVAAVNSTVNSIKQEILQTIQGTLDGFQADDTLKFSGKIEAEWREIIRQIAAAEGNCFTFRSIASLISGRTAESTYNVNNTGISVTYLGDVDRFDRDGSNVGIGEHKALSSLKIVIGHPTNLSQVAAVIEVTFDRSGAVGNYWYTGTLPPDFQLFTDDNSTVAGRRRLFLRSGADRTALEVMVTSMTGFWPANDEGVYMEGAADAWGHTNRYNLTGSAFATAKSVTDVATNVGTLTTAVSNLGVTTTDHGTRIVALENSNKVRYAQTRTIPAGDKVTIDMQSLVTDPADISKYDYLGARVNVLLLDTVTGSNSKDSYIESSGTITKAIRGGRYLDLWNYDTLQVSVVVRIELPLL